MRRAVAWSVALACVVLFGVANFRYVRNFIGGPYDLDGAGLAAIEGASAPSRYFVRVAGSRAIDTGVQQITVKSKHGVETDRSVTARYYALVVGDRFLLCENAVPNKTCEGELKPIPAELASNIFASPQAQRVRPRFYPYILTDESVGSFRAAGYWAIAAMAVFAFFLVRVGLPALRYFRNPDAHPLVRRIAGWGDPIGTSAAAEAETRSPRLRCGGWALGDKFLIRRSMFHFDLLRFADLLWAYKKVTKHSVNFIPTGKSYEANFSCYGGSATIKGKEKAVDEILGFAAQRAPWAIFGYSDEIAKHWQKRTKEFCQAVEKRKLELKDKFGGFDKERANAE